MAPAEGLAQAARKHEPDPSVREPLDFYATRVQRMRKGTGEFQDWQNPEQREIAADAMSRMRPWSVSSRPRGPQENLFDDLKEERKG